MFERAIVFLVLILYSVTGIGQIIPNGNFITEAASNLPANFRARATTKNYHSYDSNVGFSDKGSGLFDTAGKELATGYFYGFYDEQGVNPSFMAVRSGDQFTLSIRFKMDADFYNSKGSAVYLQALFYKDATSKVRPTAQIDSKRASVFNPTQPETWSLLTYDFEVPKDVSHLGVAVYFKGNGKVWVDDFTLVAKATASIQSEISQTDGTSLKFASLTRVVKIKADQQPRLASAVRRYEDQNKAQGTPLKDSVWTLREPDCHPQIRLTANIASAVLNNSKLYPDGSVTLKKAYNALDWLIRVQQDNGSFYWYPNDNCKVPVKDEGALMYEGSIAMMALRDGYLRTNEPQKKQRYLKAARDYCEFLLTTEPQANTNFNGFALWALSSFVNTANNTYELRPYLNKMWDFYEHIEKQQTARGNWPDFHNRHVYYHAIITRGLASLYKLQAQKEVFGAEHTPGIKNATYKAVNYLLSQIKGSDGSLIKHPELSQEAVKSPFPLEVVLLALEFPELTAEEQKHLEQLSTLLNNFRLMSSQGHEVAALGRYLHFKEN